MSYWADQLTKYRTFLENTDSQVLFIESVENSREMRTSYAKLGSVRAFMEWLEYKADMEAKGFNSGAVMLSVGGF